MNATSIFNKKLHFVITYVKTDDLFEVVNSCYLAFVQLMFSFDSLCLEGYREWYSRNIQLNDVLLYYLQ